VNRRELLEFMAAAGLGSGCVLAGDVAIKRSGNDQRHTVPATPHSPLPSALAQLIQEHGARYAPHYPPNDNSDHGPMAYLAMHGLGIDFQHIDTFARSYRQKLVGQVPSTTAVTAGTWEHHVGRKESYAALRAFYGAGIEERGWPATVGQYLPLLISGWVRDAFHPLIRLGYGIEFNVTSEISSGLAYLTSMGEDPQLTAIAARSPADTSARSYLESLQAWRDPSFAEGRFNDRYQHGSQLAALRPVGGTAEATLQGLSRSALEIFDATHDFFALHLVTSSHAFRVCAPWAGPGWEAVYSTGLAAAYLAIGAPEFAPLPVISTPPALPVRRLSTSSDEHDIKIAYSALRQSQAFGDPAFVQAAVRYLADR
jgi:hypothetical protein